jgi:Protein of unknown function (DUF3152)
VSRLPGASRDGTRPYRVVARRAYGSGLSPQSNPHHPGHIRTNHSAGTGRAARHRRGAAGLVAGIIALGLVGLCLRAVPAVLTDSELAARVAGPLTGIPVASPGSAGPAAPSPSAEAEPFTPAGSRLTSVKLPAERQTESVRQIEVLGSGPGTYQAAGKNIRPRTSSGALIRYDVRVEDGLSVNPDQAAVEIQKVLDNPRSWRGTRRWRFELAPVGQAVTLHAYIVTPETTDRLCAPLLTRGEVSCQRGNRVVLNAKRWLLGADAYGTDLTNYRRYLVNHEFGHALGKRHLDCPGPGRLAPVMMQQTKGLGACRKNPWPQATED